MLKLDRMHLLCPERYGALFADRGLRRLCVCLGTASIGGVWMYQGLWCKVLGGCAEQLQVAREVIGIGSAAGRLALQMVGVAEVMVAVCLVLAALWRRYCVCLACIQTFLLVVMNASGLVRAFDVIEQPVGMVLNNIVFCVLIWIVALDCEVS